MKKPVVDDAAASRESKPDRGQFLDASPLTWAMLTDDVWDDGTARERSTLLILADGGVVKLWLNDRALGRACWISGESLEEAFNSLESALYAGTAAWRGTGAVKSKKRS